jgi:hypothetical protein
VSIYCSGRPIVPIFLSRKKPEDWAGQPSNPARRCRPLLLDAVLLPGRFGKRLQSGWFAGHLSFI